MKIGRVEKWPEQEASKDEWIKTDKVFETDQVFIAKCVKKRIWRVPGT